MSFTERTISHAFAAARGQCERCPTKLNLNRRGEQWEARHKVSSEDGGSDEPSNCEVLCLECYDAIPK
jgi:hypothetical protein